MGGHNSLGPPGEDAFYPPQALSRCCIAAFARLLLDILVVFAVLEMVFDGFEIAHVTTVVSIPCTILRTRASFEPR